jgi:nucleoredoxin
VCAGGFTPELSAWAAKNGERLKTKVVFLSSDRDEKAFSEYLSEMSWKLAVPLGDPAKDALSSKFKVRGIPTLVIVDARTGELVTTDARGQVSSDPECRRFPWKPRSAAEILAGATFTDKSGAAVSAEALKGKALGLYFSAHWCPPCRELGLLGVRRCEGATL